MIQYLKGILTQKSPVSAVIETMGIGWDIRIPISTYEALPPVGHECSLLAYLHISQDDIRIYGFAVRAERELFLMLTRISGIGPKIALSVLSTLSISAFIRAVNSGEEGLLTRVPGIGKKSAQRLIVELKDEVHRLMEFVDHEELSDHSLEVENALISLGFNAVQIRKELGLLDEADRNRNTEELIKEIIKRIYQRNK